MLQKIPTDQELISLIGEKRFDVWQRLCAAIEEKYEMDRMWNPGGKSWDYEYKYRRGGRTLCALYAREGDAGFMVIFGKEERAKFEQHEGFSKELQKKYDDAYTFHDGKWVMFDLEDAGNIAQYIEMLQLKRRPNRK